MDIAYQIFEYLPMRYKNEKDLGYFGLLVKSVESNYSVENYHFAFVGLHMIYMGIVYHSIYAMSQADSEQFENVLIGHHKALEIRDSSAVKSWDSFSRIRESTIFEFYRAVRISHEEIKKLKAPVKQRNKALHVNEAYLISKEEFDKRSAEYLQNLEKIQESCSQVYEKLFFQFLRGFQIEVADVDEGKLRLEEFIADYGVSMRSLEQLAKIQEKEYPYNTKFIYNAIQDMLE
ncbi:MAG: hypothetical protein OXU34_06700 [Gammaproteobacteria bacterium]|nr:hypothetical protein [Gammaproteobacteria bacterium]